MEHSEFLERLYRIHWRLRLRSPVTPVERKEWAEVREELRRIFKDLDENEEPDAS